MKRILLILLCFGMLVVMDGCYVEPYPYDYGGFYVPYYYGPTLRFYGDFSYYNHHHGDHHRRRSYRRPRRYGDHHRYRRYGHGHHRHVHRHREWHR